MSKAKFYKLAESAGVEVTFRTGRNNPRTGEAMPFEITLDAPEGKTFRHSGCSVDCSIRGRKEQPKIDWSAAYKALYEIVEYGFDEVQE